jgi:hypothetical protein
MGNVIEFSQNFKKQIKDNETTTIRNNKPMTRVYNFESPLLLYSDEEGQLFTSLYNPVQGKTMAIPYFDSLEGLFEHEKRKAGLR